MKASRWRRRRMYGMYLEETKATVECIVDVVFTGRVTTAVDKQHDDRPFSYFFYIADGSVGNATFLYFSDTKAHCIRRFTDDGNFFGH